MNEINLNKKENFDKISLILINNKIKFVRRFSGLINVILFEIFFILLPKLICYEQPYVEIKVNSRGYNQIISNDYIGTMPTQIYINNIPSDISDKKVYVNSIDDLIRLSWTKTISDFSFMFSNLENIISVHMNYMFNNHIIMSYMFYNCYNLESFTYKTYYDISHSMEDMKYMFYNCISLKSFQFKDLYMTYYHHSESTHYSKEKSEDVTTHSYYYNYINMSYMFYNCQSLESVYFDSNIREYITNMKEMFYNCFSLTSLNLTNIVTQNHIDVSYMFYNCTKLEYFYTDYSRYYNYYIRVKDMNYMFYNCISLKKTYLSNFASNDFDIDMTNLFYNCYSLNSISGFSGLRISHTDNMFYNCTSLKSINFNPKIVISQSNMEKMFYNCTQIHTIIFDISQTSSSSRSSIINNYNPSNLNYIFYNCISLEVLKFNYFQTDYINEISYLLYNCYNLKNITMYKSNFTNPLITNMRGVFENCESLTSLDLTSFYTPNVIMMWDMFKNCKSLKYLDIPKFDTSKVTDMESMFEGCESLISLDIKHFNTINVRYMNKMFKNCKSLQSLYFNNINSTTLGSMQQMFYNCRSLEYLNIYSLTEQFQSISEMFEGASNNFIVCVKEHENIPNIFEEILKRSGTQRDCSEDCYGIGNKRPHIIEKKICYPMFEFNGICYDKCPGRTEATNEDKICKYFNCSPNYYNYEQDDCINVVPEGFYVNNNELNTIDKCYKTCKTCNWGLTGTKQHCLACNETYPYLDFSNCVELCDNGYYTDSGIRKCKCPKKECTACTEESFVVDLCVTCNEGYYKKSDDEPHSNNYINCYKDPPKYYLDNSNKIYRPCYSSCEKCYGNGDDNNHNCKTCNLINSFAISNNLNGYESNNCYPNCSYYYYFDDNNKYHCTITNECPHDYKFLIVDLRRCVKSCNVVSDYSKRLRYECYKECPSGISTQSEDNPNKCNSQCTFDYPFLLILEDICVASCSIMERSQKLCITSYYGNRTNLELQEIIHKDINKDLEEAFNYSIITESNTVLIEENETNYEIVTTHNKNTNSNTTSILLGECEDRLKEYYEIDKDEYLYMLVINAYIEGKTGPKPIYEVYYPLFNSPFLFQLDLSICDGLEINILYNMELENPELYNKDNPIYNDMCYPYTSKPGADMTLTDVQNDYKDNNRLICEEGCKFEYFNKKVGCKCEVSPIFPPLSEIKIDKDKLYKFAKIKNVANFGALKCINLLTIKERMISNIGIYSFIPTIIAYIVCIIVFNKVDFKTIKDHIKNILYAILNLKYIKNKKPKKPINKNGFNFIEPIFIYVAKKKDLEISDAIMRQINDLNIKNARRIKKNSIRIKQRNLNSDSKSTKSEDYLNINNSKDITNKKEKHSPPIKKVINKIENKTNEKQIATKNSIKKNNGILIPNKVEKKLSEKEIKRIKEILAYNDKELNDLDFKLALKNDNRNMIQIYYSFLKTDHILIKILNSKDYNSRFIKIFLCFYNFSLSFTMNALFFNDETIHKIFEDEGQFNFIYQLPQIIYSSILSYLLGMILDYLALSEDNILELKIERVPKKAKEKSKEILRTLKIKFLLFFIISFLFLLVFWYYIICFCAVYINTQYHLLNDSIIGFGTGLLIPLGTKLIPLVFRKIGLKSKNKFIFLISKLIQFFL